MRLATDPQYGGDPWSAEVYRVLNGKSRAEWHAYWAEQYPDGPPYWIPTPLNPEP